MIFYKKFIPLGAVLAGTFFLSGCGSQAKPDSSQDPSSATPSKTLSDVNLNRNLNDNYLGSDNSGSFAPQNVNTNNQIDTQKGLAQPLTPLPADSKQAIDGEVKSINQDLDNLDKDSDSRDLGL